MKLILFFIANAIRIKYSLLLVLILLPTFFITNNHIHDWGDDFAQYIYQSQQINTPSDTYKQVLNVEEFSSPKRSLFFSMVLSSITPTHSISPYLNVIAILYIVAAVICFLFFTLNYSIYVSFIATLCLFYNFLFLRQKSEVLSEFLFIALFYITIHLIQLHKAKLKYIILVLIALLISVRFIGVSLLVAYIIHILFLKIDSKKQKAIDVFTGLIVVVLIMTCINFFIIPDVSNHEVSLYSSYTKSTFNVFTIPHNIQTYSKYILYFFEQEIPYYLNTIIKSLVVILFGVGFYFSVKKQFGIIDLALVCYIAFLFFFPYTGDAIRYLIPILPLFFYYSINGVLSSPNGLLLYFQQRALIWFLLIILLSNVNTIRLEYSLQKERTGPYTESVQTDFAVINNLCQPNETVAFSKPFLINLFCDRNSYYLTNTNYPRIIKQATYLLLPKKEIGDLYASTNTIKLIKGDTIPLTHFYLVKL